MYPYAHQGPLYSCEECREDGRLVCSKCKAFYYCCQGHQRQGHARHKWLCNTLHAIGEGQSRMSEDHFQRHVKDQLQDEREWQASFVLSEFVSRNSSQPSEEVHSDILKVSRRFCRLKGCSTHASLKERLKKKLTPCPHCYGVAYCCKEHLEADQESHKTECAALAVARNVHRLLHYTPSKEECQGNDRAKMLPYASVAICNSRPLTVCSKGQIELSATSFEDFFSKGELRVASPSLGFDMSLRPSEIAHHASEVRALLADALSAPLTLAHALAATGLLSDNDNEQMVELHVLGAGLQEWWCMGTFEELLLRWKCDSLHVVLIGPDLQLPDTAVREESANVSKQCFEGNKRLSLSYHSTGYKSFLEGSGSSKKPSVRVSFNAALASPDQGNVLEPTPKPVEQKHELRRWEEDVDCISSLDDDVPFVVTALSAEESDQNAEFLRKMGFSCTPSLTSPFASPLISPKALSSSTVRMSRPNDSFLVALSGRGSVKEQSLMQVVK